MSAPPPPPPPLTAAPLRAGGVSASPAVATTSTGMYNDPPPELFFRGGGSAGAGGGGGGGGGGAKEGAEGNVLSQAEMRTVLEAYLAVGTSRELAGANSKMAEDTVKRMQALLAALGNNTISPRVADLLRPLVAAVRDGRYKAALDLHIPIMTNYYTESAPWIAGLKRLLALSADLPAAS